MNKRFFEVQYDSSSAMKTLYIQMRLERRAPFLQKGFLKWKRGHGDLTVSVLERITKNVGVASTLRVGQVLFKYLASFSTEW